MRKRLLAGAALALLAALAIGAYGAFLGRRLDTPQFQRSLVDRASATLGAEVRVRSMELSLLSGITLEGLAVANPAPFRGDLLSADALVLRYRLWPLLAGRVDVERLALERPVLGLVADAKGAFNYERLGTADAKAGPVSPAAAVPLRLDVKRLAVADGSILLADRAGARLLVAEGAHLRSAFVVEGGSWQGSGEASVATASLGDVLFLKDVRAPLVASRRELRLAPVRARVAGGEATGEVRVRLEGGFRYEAGLEARGVAVRTLLSEAKSAAAVSGTLRATARFEGTGGMATLRGRGEGTVDGCRLERAGALVLLAGILGVPELESPDLDECRAEFTQTGSVVRTPVLRLSGKAVRLTGEGAVDLETSRLDYRMSLGLAPRLLAKVTRPELRSAFRDQGDGFSTVEFRLHGTTAAPRTDLLSRLGRAAAGEAAKGQVERLLGRKIFRAP
jgi:hypothetical protein